LTSIDYYAFTDCSGLTAINVDAANTAYSSQDGILYSKDKTSLHIYPAGKTGAFTIPNGVTTIVSIAFSSCTSLTSITIPDSVTSIGFNAFYGCTGLTSVTFQGTIRLANFGSHNDNALGDLRAKYLLGGIGTYTRPSGSTEWTKIN